MAIEIERKFLLQSNTWRQAIINSTPYRQGYIATTADRTCSVRVRIAGDQGMLTIKSATLGLQRQEYEYAIPLSDAQEMLDTLAASPQSAKIRHLVPYQGHTWEIDEFQGDNAGLIVAEIELNSPTETFARPDWLGPEVSGEARYYNVNLAQNPYSSW